MPEQSGRRFGIEFKLLIIALSFILLNTGLVIWGLFFVMDYLTFEQPVLAYKQELAHDLSDYNHRLAVDLNVYDVQTVREALAEYNYAVDLAESSEELIQIMVDQGRKAQETIFAEADARLKEKVLIAVNNDIRVQETYGRTHLFIRVSYGTISILPDQYLEPGTVQVIEEIYASGQYHSSQNIDLIISDGAAEIAVPQTEEEQIRALNEDLNSLRLRLHELRVQCGLAEMVGPGIILSVYDAEEQQNSMGLVHDADIRDIVNELFSSGASGVSVGGQRLTATSSIRCVGPIIMVNYRQIVTNPVVIQAIGDPDLLISGLNIIMFELETKRGLFFNITDSGFIKLPAYDRVE
jgi:hypothetical protein